MKQAKALLTLALAAVAGCSFHARGPDEYRKATREVLDTQSSSVEACYRRELQDAQDSKGTVVISFEVEAKTGNIVKAQVVEEKTTGDARLQKCVLESLTGIKLDPPDQRTGQATFEWEFERS